jgi:hypothetical protein
MITGKDSYHGFVSGFRFHHEHQRFSDRRQLTPRGACGVGRGLGSFREDLNGNIDTCNFGRVNYPLVGGMDLMQFMPVGFCLESRLEWFTL